MLPWFWARAEAVGENAVKVTFQRRVLNPRPEAVTDDRFRTGEFFDPRDLVQVKYEMVRRVEEERAPVTETVEALIAELRRVAG